MGCGASACTVDNTDEATVLRRYRKRLASREPGYLARDPSTLSHYKLLLLQEGAESLHGGDDDDNDDILSEARDITVVTHEQQHESRRSSLRHSISPTNSLSHQAPHDSIDSRRFSISSSSSYRRRSVSFAPSLLLCSGDIDDNEALASPHPCTVLRSPPVRDGDLVL